MKMKKPALEVMHFGRTDIIATSGANKVGFLLSENRIAGEYYVLLGSEGSESEIPAYSNAYYNTPSFAENPWAFFAPSISTLDRAYVLSYGHVYDTDLYAFFDEGQWWTENQTIKYYEQSYNLSRNSTAGWRTTRTQ